MFNELASGKFEQYREATRCGKTLILLFRSKHKFELSFLNKEKIEKWQQKALKTMNELQNFNLLV